MNRPMMDGRSMRVDPLSVSESEMSAFMGLKDGVPKGKMDEIRRGGNLRKEFPPFPEHRPCQDGLWVVLFFLTVVLTLGAGWASSDTLTQVVNDKKDTDMEGLEFPPGKVLAATVMAGTCGSIVMAFLCVVLAHRAPGCVVWTSLLFTPVFMILIGVVLMLGMVGVANSGTDSQDAAAMAATAMIVGGIFVAIGLCQLCCIMRLKALVPFTITVTEIIADVIEDHPCLLIMSVIGAGVSFAWTVSCLAAFVAVYLQNQELVDESNEKVRYVGIFITTLIFVWGAGVCVNVCHVTYAGVFGRWYYGEDAHQGPLMPSLKAAMTTSLGSVCMGSFLVAFVRAMSAVAEQVQRDAMEDGNPVMCVVACIIKCVIDIIGDILEYFNEWAYIQCAVRGTNFWKSASITYSMMTCANMKYLISDLLLNSVVGFGSMLCALAACIAGGATGYVLDGTVAAIWGACLGFIVGSIAGGAALSIVSSGAKTVLVCWADDPTPFQENNEEVANEFQERIGKKMMDS